MSLGVLPNEIRLIIFTIAVKERGIRRATRLRLVSRAWDGYVTEAIFSSGILDSSNAKLGGEYRRRYLTWRIMHRPQTLSRPLCIIRKVGVALATWRGLYRPAMENGNKDEKDRARKAIEDCVYEISNIPHRPDHMVISIPPLAWHNITRINNTNVHTDPTSHTDPIHTDPIHDGDPHYLQALLAAAAWTNEIALIVHIQSSYDCRHIVSRYMDPLTYMDFIFASPLHLAAYRGHTDIVEKLVDSFVRSDGTVHPYMYERLWEEIVPNAVDGSQPAPIDWAFRHLPPQRYYSSIELAMQRVRDRESFRILQGNVIRFFPNTLSYPRQFAWDETLLMNASEDDNYDTLSYVLRSPPLRTAELPYPPLLTVVEKGSMKTLLLLLNWREPLESDGPEVRLWALYRAARRGNLEILDVILERYSGLYVQMDWERAMLVAMKREHDAVVRRLLRHFGPVRFDLNTRWRIG
ncbi:hypothetical protein F4778DRAFT_752211 [Xylariomycetidae sp. FL2044]|nr:hypothetical protein F4778DRAFT_752211 [Xylariomycetidae sp. FL2044]